MIKIATRESELALWQARFVASELQACHPNLDVELVPMTTRGDQLLDRPLAAIGGKGLFLKELEQALLDGRADIAVHSMKDVPAEMPDGLILPVVLKRHDPRDALVSNRYGRIDELPEAAVVGTSSLRRQAQLRRLRPDLRIKDLRGNVNTRLRKLDEGQYDAIILAAAGLDRLEMGERIRQRIEPGVSLPAVAQGVIGIECRADDQVSQDLIRSVHHAESSVCVDAERSFSARLGGSCQVPLAAHATLQAEGVHLAALVASPDGKQVVEGTTSGAADQARGLGLALAENLMNQGAKQILEAL
jgi:hydroxymethylbilane synthase